MMREDQEEKTIKRLLKKARRRALVLSHGGLNHNPKALAADAEAERLQKILDMKRENR